MRTAPVSVLGSVSFGWLHDEGGFVVDEPFFMEPLVRREREAAMHAFVARRFPRDPVYNIEAHLVQVEGRRCPVILVGGIQPNLILGAAVGARFVFYGDKDPDMTQSPLKDITSLEPLWKINWASTWPISLFLEQIERLRREEAVSAAHAEGGNADRSASGGAQPPVIIPPYFWDTTGRATTHGIVTTAQKLMGERVFLEMVDNPSFVHEFLDWIVDAYVKQIHLFAAAAGLPVTGLHTGDCSVCMIGPRQFEEFVLPHLNDFARRVGPLRLHSCGTSDHLLDTFQHVAGLASLNVGSNTRVAAIRERFGPMRIDLIPDTQLLTSGKPADVEAWVRRSVEENGDGRLEFQYHLDAGQPQETCLQINRTLESLGINTPRTEVF